MSDMPEKPKLNDEQKNKLLLGFLIAFLGVIIFCDYYFLVNVVTNRFALTIAVYLFLGGLTYSSFVLFSLPYFSVMGRWIPWAIGLICVLVLEYSIGLREGVSEQDSAHSFTILLAALGTIVSLGAISEKFIAGKSKGKDITEDNIDYQSDRAALKALGGVSLLILGFGWLAYNYMNGAKKLFTGDITITMVVLFAGGIATFYWGAKSNFVRVRQTEEQIKDGKRQDARDTAQLIADAAKLLGGQSDAEKYAGLAFLNNVASKEDTPFSKQAFDMIYHYVLYEKDQTTANKTRMAAIKYLEVLNDKYETWDKGSIILQASPDDRFLQQTFKLLIRYKNFTIVRMNFENTFDFSEFENCFFDGCRITGIYPINCSFWACIIESVCSIVTGVGYWTKYNEEKENILEFEQSDLSGFDYHGSFTEIKVDRCFYDADNPPNEYFLETHKDNLTAKDPQ